jgi:hypothetical protein
MGENTEQLIRTSFTILFQILSVQQESRKKRLKNIMKRMRTRLRKLCLQQTNKLLIQWSQMTDPKSPVLILDGAQYQRIWTKVRSNDFWQRIVGEHFTLSEWLATFRMSKATFTRLCDIIRTELEPKPLFLVSRQPLSVEKQVAIAIYKLASCAEYRVIGDVMGVHKSTVRKCLFRVTMAINNIMAKDYICMPSEEEAQYISTQYQNKSFIPQLIGSIDGTHIPITAPHVGYRDFVNRKGWSSYNVMAIVDHNGRLSARLRAQNI